MAEFADELEVDLADAIDKCLFGIIAISGQLAHLEREEGPLSSEMQEIPIDAAPFSTKETSYRGRVWRLLHGQMIGCAVVDIHDGECGKFQAFFRSAVAGIIEMIKTVCPFAAFGNHGAIDGPNFRGGGWE